MTLTAKGLQPLTRVRPSPYYFAESFGVTGDGTTDDTAALIAAIAGTPNGGLLYLAPGMVIKITSAITLTERKALTITSLVDARNYGTQAPRIEWEGGSNGIMFDLVRCQTTHILGLYFERSAGSVDRAIRIDGSGGAQVSTANVVQYCSFDFSDQSNAAFAAISISDTAVANNENFNVSFNHILGSSGTGASAVGIGIYIGANPNAKHHVFRDNGVSQCAYGFKADGGSYELVHLGGSANGVDIYTRANSEPVLLSFIETENSIVGADIIGGSFSNTVVLDHYRIENSQQGSYFLKLRGNVALQYSYVYATPGASETVFETAIDGVGLNLLSFHNTYIDASNNKISTAKLGWDAIQIVANVGSRIHSFFDIGIVDGSGNDYAMGNLSFQPYLSVPKGAGLGVHGYISRGVPWDGDQRYYGIFGGNNGGLAIGNEETILTSNAYWDGSGVWKYIYAGLAARIKQTAGVITLETAISGSAGGTITWQTGGTFSNGLFVQGEGAALTVSSNTIVPTHAIHAVGAGLIKTITIPTGFASGTIALRPTAAFTYDATNNIMGAGTAVIDRTMFATLSSSTAKWTMSY